MGLFSNPLGYAGYPPAPLKMTGGVQEPGSQNTTVRAATETEVSEGIRADIYVSPATAQAEIIADFSEPPPLGDVTPNTVAATTLTSSGNTTLATSAAATTIDLGNVANSGARITTIAGGNSAQNDTVNILNGANTTNAHIFNVLTGAISGGTSSANFYTGIITGGTHQFKVFTAATAGTLSVNIGTCDKNVTMLIGTGIGINIITLGGTISQLGFFGVTPVVKPVGTTDLKDALVNLGLYTDGGATPLNLDAGALSCGDLTAVGTVNINASGAGVTTIGTGGTGATNIGNGTGNTAVTGSLTATTTAASAGIAVDANSSAGTGIAGRFTSSAATVDSIEAVTGSIKVPATSVAAASPVVNDVRTGQASFTDSIANGAYGTLTITNSMVTGASTVVIASASCTTANSALQIVEITPSAGSLALRLFNAGSAATAANILINFWVLN